MSIHIMQINSKNQYKINLKLLRLLKLTKHIELIQINKMRITYDIIVKKIQENLIYRNSKNIN